jgi:hypothetical protein
MCFVSEIVYYLFVVVVVVVTTIVSVYPRVFGSSLEKSCNLTNVGTIDKGKS